MSYFRLGSSSTIARFISLFIASAPVMASGSTDRVVLIPYWTSYQGVGSASYAMYIEFSNKGDHYFYCDGVVQEPNGAVYVPTVSARCIPVKCEGACPRIEEELIASPRNPEPQNGQRRTGGFWVLGKDILEGPVRYCGFAFGYPPMKCVDATFTK